MIVTLAVAAYLASNAALGWFIAQELNTQSAVTKIERILKIEHVGGKGHHGYSSAGRNVSPSKHGVNAVGQSPTHGRGSVTTGRTVTHTPHGGGVGGGGGVRHPHGFTGPGHPGSGGNGGGGHHPSHHHKSHRSSAATVSVPSQHVGPVTTPSLNVTVPLPHIHHLPHLPHSLHPHHLPHLP